MSHEITAREAEAAIGALLVAQRKMSHPLCVTLWSELERINRPRTVRAEYLKRHHRSTRLHPEEAHHDRRCTAKQPFTEHEHGQDPALGGAANGVTKKRYPRVRPKISRAS